MAGSDAFMCFKTFLTPVLTQPFFPYPLTAFLIYIGGERQKKGQKESLPLSGIEPATSRSQVKDTTYRATWSGR